MSPPMTTVASSAPTTPALSEMKTASGSSANDVVNAVIRMGRSLVRPPSISASWNDSPRLPTETSVPPIADLVPVLAYGQDGSTAAAARALRRSAHRRCILTPLIRRQATALVRGKSTDLDKALAIHAFVPEKIVAAVGSGHPTRGGLGDPHD